MLLRARQHLIIQTCNLILLAHRFAAITALATLLRRRQVQPKALLHLIGDGTLLPVLTQELDEDWWVWKEVGVLSYRYHY